MKKRIIAFWDMLFRSIISAFLLSVTIYIIVFIKGDTPWYSVPVRYTILAAFCLAVSVTLVLFVSRIVIDLNCDKVELFYLVNYNTNSKDLNSNWNIFPSEIKKVTVVKLSNEEKRRYTSAKFLFSKYLKIEMKYGHTKYVYVSHYSNYQINRIIKLLTSGHCISTKDGSVSC